MPTSVPAFQDSHDSGDDIGTCGEKVVALDASTPAFLTLTKDSDDPTLNPFTITYSQSGDEADMKLHTISYEVTSKWYGS